jgi:hypothetical protein
MTFFFPVNNEPSKPSFSTPRINIVSFFSFLIKARQMPNLKWLSAIAQEPGETRITLFFSDQKKIGDRPNTDAISVCRHARLRLVFMPGAKPLARPGGSGELRFGDPNAIIELT